MAAQLVETGTRLDVWSHTYDADMAGLLDVQEGIATEICRALKVRLSRADRGLARSQAVNTDAYEA